MGRELEFSLKERRKERISKLAVLIICQTPIEELRGDECQQKELSCRLRTLRPDGLGFM